MVRMAFPEVKIIPEESLDEAFQRAFSALKDAGYDPIEPESINALLSSKTFGKLFNVFTKETNEIFYVCTSVWTESITLNVLNDLLRLRMTAPEIAHTGRVVIRFLSGHPVPPSLEYILSDTSHGRFESACMLRLKLPAPLSPADMPSIGERALVLMKEIYRDPPRLEDLASAEKIDRIILNEMRAGAPHNQSLPDDAYSPDYSLIAVGTILGEMLRRNPALDARWVKSPECLMNVGVEIKLKVGGQAVTVNPLGKIVKLYRTGVSEAVAPFIAAVLQHLMKSHGIQ